MPEGGAAIACPPSGAERHAVTHRTRRPAHCPPAPAPAVELRGIVKRFPGVVANDGVDFTPRRAARSTPCSARTAPARAR